MKKLFKDLTTSKTEPNYPFKLLISDVNVNANFNTHKLTFINIMLIIENQIKIMILFYSEI